jgi:hypothetical protein
MPDDPTTSNSNVYIGGSYQSTTSINDSEKHDLENVSIGKLSRVLEDHNVAVGSRTSSSSASVAIGYKTEAHKGSIAIGWRSLAVNNSITIGQDLFTSISNRITIGDDSHFEIVLGPIEITFGTNTIIFKKNNQTFTMNLT